MVNSETIQMNKKVRKKANNDNEPKSEKDKIAPSPKVEIIPLSIQKLFEAILIHSKKITEDTMIKNIVKNIPPLIIENKTTDSKNIADIALV